MKQLGIAAVPVLLALGVASCSDSLSPESLAGTYDVTAMDLVNPANPSQTVDLLDPGVSYTIVIAANGSFTSFTDGNLEGTGTLTIDGDTFTLTSVNDTTTGTITQNGDTITLYQEGLTNWDWDDNVQTPATTSDARIVMVRRP